MKKLFTVLLLALSIQAFSTSVTFMLKMAGEDLPLDSVFIVGFVTDWQFEAMLELGDSLYTWSTNLEPGVLDEGSDSLAYYFITVNSWDSAGNEDWNWYKKFREYFDITCAERYPLRHGSDRWIVVPEQDTTVMCYFAECPDYSPPSGINDHSARRFSLDIYPNPSEGDVTLKVPESQNLVSINVIDISGKLLNIDKSFINSTEVRLKTSILPKGVYFIRVQNNEFSTVRKLIIK